MRGGLWHLAARLRGSMALAFDPGEQNPLVSAFREDRGIPPGSVELAIDERDEMLSFLLESWEGDRDRALFAYFRSGESIARTLERTLSWRFGEAAAAGPVLDFASGYGRVTRFLRRWVPAESLRVSDVYTDALRFQEERLGVRGYPSTVRPEELSIPERFGAVLVTSLFTHLPEERFVGWLRALLGLLRPGGLLAFSVHDEALVVGRAVPAGGMLFEPLSESRSLDANDYGSAWVTEAFVRRAAAAACPEISLHRLPRALCSFQDLYLAVREPDADFSGLRAEPEPELFVETFRLTGTDRAEAAGWALSRFGEVREVQITLGGRTVGTAPIDLPRPDVVEVFGAERALRSGWQCRWELPPGTSRGTVPLLLRVVDGSGYPHLLLGGSVDAFRLGGMKNEVLVLQHELRQARERAAEAAARAAAETAGLRARIAAMEASRFWKMRNAWFRLKRGLGWTE
jgi:SAM-dependent methyltransferase